VALLSAKAIQAGPIGMNEANLACEPFNAVE
jgi:hypothetical protein